MVHALRHPFATPFAEDGATATEFQALLSHESLNTSQGYIHATVNTTRQAVRAKPTYRALEGLARMGLRRPVTSQPELGYRRVGDAQAPVGPLVLDH